VNPQNTWLNGRVVPWDESRIHVGTDAVLRGASVFEGLRAYRSVAGDDLLLFRVADHMHRLFGTSMRFLRMRAPYAPDELLRGVIELLQSNQVRGDAHVRVVVYFDEVEVGHELEGATGAFILAFERPPSPRLTTGVRATLSPWRRLSDSAMSPRVKASANYLNGRVVGVDARAKGFDTAVMLNEHGRVSEGPGQNVFLVRDGVLITPRTTDAILEGITRETIIGLARERGMPVQEREVDPDRAVHRGRAVLRRHRLGGDAGRGDRHVRGRRRRHGPAHAEPADRLPRPGPGRGGGGGRVAHARLRPARPRLSRIPPGPLCRRPPLKIGFGGIRLSRRPLGRWWMHPKGQAPVLWVGHYSAYLITRTLQLAT
jgi:branched-chain amino acid aminotransferase